MAASRTAGRGRTREIRAWWNATHPDEPLGEKGRIRNEVLEEWLAAHPPDVDVTAAPPGGSGDDTTPQPDETRTPPPGDAGDGDVPPSPLSLEEARERAGSSDAGVPGPPPDPGRPKKDTGEIRITRAVRADIEGKCAFWGMMIGDVWAMFDPYCAGVYAENLDTMIKKGTPLLLQSPDIVKWFQKTSNWILWTEFGMSLRPLLAAIWAHHIARTVGREPQAGDYVPEDLAAQYSTETAWNGVQAA